MRRGVLFQLVASVLLGFFALCAPVSAREIPASQSCHAAARLDESYAALASSPARWTCGQSGWGPAAQATFIRFTLTPGGGALADHFVTRTSRLAEISFIIIDMNGNQRRVERKLADAAIVRGGSWMAFPLPAVTADTRAVIVRIAEPWLPNALTEARLTSDPQALATPLPRLLFYAALCGLLMAPLLLNMAFYQVLRERFVLWHYVMVFGMLTQVMVSTGLANLLLPLPLWFTAPFSFWIYSAVCGAAHVFTASFIEPGMLDPRLRRYLRKSAPFVPLFGLIQCLPVPALRPWASVLFHIGMLPTIFLVSAALWNAWRRGSVMVRYQLVGWVPPIIAALYRISSFMAGGGLEDSGLLVYNCTLGLEVIATTLGTISRLYALRQERDWAQLRASQLESVAGIDPLTGLHNRLALERRFGEFYRAGFRTMAVLDLDHFKQINDRFGHRRGDDVLCAVAEVLAPDKDTHAVRLGGEEFLLLLRGPDAAQRAERRRQAIPARVAAQVRGLDRMVTASMGLVEREKAGTLRADFRELYDHCDRLLYEAKRAGRNRTMRERIQSFAAPRAKAHEAGG